MKKWQNLKCTDCLFFVSQSLILLDVPRYMRGPLYDRRSEPAWKRVHAEGCLWFMCDCFKILGIIKLTLKKVGWTISSVFLKLYEVKHTHQREAFDATLKLGILRVRTSRKQD